MFLSEELEEHKQGTEWGVYLPKGSTRGLNRGQAGRPRALGPAGLGCFWLLSTSIFSGGFLVQLFVSVQYILYALHHPNHVNHSFFAFDVHLQHYFSTLCHSLVPCLIIHHMVPSLLKITCPSHAWLLPPLNYLHVVVGREHNSFRELTLINGC